MPNSSVEHRRRLDARVNPPKTLELKLSFVFPFGPSKRFSDLGTAYQTSSEERRRRLLLIDSVPQVPLPVLPPIQSTGPSLNSLPSTEIPRPRSCPPTFPAWRLGDTPNVPVERSKSLDRASIDGVT